MSGSELPRVYQMIDLIEHRAHPDGTVRLPKLQPIFRAKLFGCCVISIQIQWLKKYLRADTFFDTAENDRVLTQVWEGDIWDSYSVTKP